MKIIRSEGNTFAYFKRQGSASRRKDRVDTLLSNVRLLDLKFCSVIKYTNTRNEYPTEVKGEAKTKELLVLRVKFVFHEVSY